MKINNAFALIAIWGATAWVIISADASGWWLILPALFTPTRW